MDHGSPFTIQQYSTTAHRFGADPRNFS